MSAAEVRAVPAGTHLQTAVYPPSKISQAVATYQLPRRVGFIFRLILHSIVSRKEFSFGEVQV